MKWPGLHYTVYIPIPSCHAMPGCEHKIFQPEASFDSRKCKSKKHSWGHQLNFLDDKRKGKPGVTKISGKNIKVGRGFDFFGRLQPFTLTSDEYLFYRLTPCLWL